MKVTRLLPYISLVIVIVISDTKQDISEEENDEEDSVIESVGTGRVFPFLPPSQGVDFLPS